MSSEDSYTFPCLAVHQPIGNFFVAVMPSDALLQVSFNDVRRELQEGRDVERYLGIQRPLNPKRVSELQRYVNTADATFPSAIILAIDGKCVYINEASNKMTLHPFIGDDVDDSIPRDRIARVLDGQHRIAGLEKLQKTPFDVVVSIFVDMDIADQAYLFSTVNLEQTKVNKSLAYDLFSLATTRSPQKTCHDIAIVLDRDVASPFFEKIKRLGVATRGRFRETLTQATFVEALMGFITRDAKADRDALLRGKSLPLATGTELARLPFRNLFIRESDAVIADIVWNYFDAVRERWPVAWSNPGNRNILSKGTGFRAFMRLLRPLYRRLMSPDGNVKEAQFFEALESVQISDDDFNIERYAPGAIGETRLYKDLLVATDSVEL